MDFRDSPAEAAFRAEARAFLDKHAPAGGLGQIYDEGRDEADFVKRSVEWQGVLYEHGWAAIAWPTAYGGRGLGIIEQIIWNQELARAGFGLSIFMVGIGMAGPTIIAHGTEEHKRRFLPPMLEGREIWCQLFSEPDAGSDLAGLACRAERDGDHWVVTGQKTWSSGAHYSDYGILLARTDPNLPKHKGISYFLVDMRTPGIDVRPLKQMTGESHFSEVFFEDVRIPHAAMLAVEGAGWMCAMTTLMNERMAIGGGEGMMRVDQLLSLARSRGGALDAVTRDELARVYTWSRCLEFMNARMLTKMSRGENPMAEASVMKLAMARLTSAGADLGMKLIGTDALANRGEWVHKFLFAPALHIAGGTDEVQKNIAAETVLGLPKEPRVDKDVPFKEVPRGVAG